MWVTVELDADDHQCVVDYANMRGLRISAAVAELVRIALEHLDDNSPRMQLWRMAYVARRRLQDFTTLQTIAASLPGASAEEHEQFSALCRALGFSEAEVLQAAAGVDFTLARDENTMRAVQALRDLLARNGGEMRASAAEEEMRLRGFSKAAITAARRALRVESVRGARFWVWRLPEEVAYEYATSD